MSSLRSIAVLSGALLSGEAAKNARSPSGFSALARLYDFAHPTKTAMLRRVTNVG